FAAHFPQDYRQLIERLRQDHPAATLVPMTIIPYMGEQRDKEVNDIVRAVAAEQKLPLFDIYPRYAAELKSGENMLNYRRMPLASGTEQYHGVLGDARRGDAVIVLDNRLDAHLRNVPNWFADRHPNLAGYHVIGDETAKFLATKIRERKKP